MRLEQGRFDRVVTRPGDPVTVAGRLAEAGATLIHLVDLDGARSGRIRPELVASVVDAARPARVQASGGIRALADAERLLDATAQWIDVRFAAA